MFLRAEMLLLWFLCCWASQSSAIVVRGDGDVMVKNGSSGTLNFTFTSDRPVSNFTRVEWSFRSNQADHTCFSSRCTILLYENRTLFHRLREFEDRLRFVGDVDQQDVSVQLSPVRFSDSGFYLCVVSNKPDSTGPMATTQLHVRGGEAPTTPTGDPPTKQVLVLVLVPVFVVSIIIIIIVVSVTIFCRRR